MHRECKQREKTQSPAGWERDKTAESFPKTNFNILHCTTAPKEVTHAEIFFSSKQKTFLDHCCCNLFSAFESMQLMEFWRLRSRVLFAQASLFANNKHGWLSISHHCYTPRRAKMFEKKAKKVKSGTKMLLIHTVECLQTENTKGIM